MRTAFPNPVLETFAKAARHTGFMIGQSVKAQANFLTSIDAFRAYRDGHLAPNRIAEQFLERAQPLLALTSRDLATPAEAPALTCIQSCVHEVIAPNLDLAAHDWQLWFPAGENPVKTMMRLNADPHGAKDSINTIGMCLGQSRLALARIETLTDSLLQALTRHPA